MLDPLGMLRAVHSLRRAVVVAVALAVTPFLIGNALLLLAHPWTADVAYALPGFPDPRIDLAEDERSRLAAVGVRAIQPWSADGIEAMRQARLDDGRRAFVAAELRHFEDVRDVVVLFLAAWAGAVVVIAAAAGLLRDDRSVARRGLWAGAWLALGAFALLSVFMLVGFGAFFEAFHAIFFEGDTWRLPTLGTALSLYPDAFWALMGGAMAVIVLAQAAAILFALRPRVRREDAEATARARV